MTIREAIRQAIPKENLDSPQAWSNYLNARYQVAYFGPENILGELYDIDTKLMSIDKAIEELEKDER